uniref:Sterol regulatory element-binding protein cleavage-activating protein n=1 Tax=Plectus sambesii TaxID=2011161 RepID=A0A914WWA5_9BILA
MKRRGKLFNSANKKSNRLRILYYWTRTRIVQRVIMVVTVVWILWLAFIVHQWRLLGNSPKSVDSQSNETDSASDGFGVSHRRISTAPLEWSLWQKRTFRWWPVLLDEYNMSLSGHYITFLPPIVLSAIVPPDDSSIKYSGGARERTVAQEQTQLASGDDSGGVGLTVGGPGTELKYRISWLELQMTVILVISVSLFATVAAFILYVCFWRHGGDASRIAQEVMQSPKKTHRRVGSRAIVEAVPLVFAGHERDVECVCYDDSGIIASSCIGGRLLVWNAATGDCFRQLPRAGPNVAPPPRSRMPGVSISEAPSSSPEHESLLRRRAVSNVSAASGQSGSSFLTSRSPNVSISEPVDFGARGDEQQRSATVTAAPAAPVPPPPSQIWCMTMNKQNIILAGCANGTVEIWDVASGNALGLYNRSSIGVTYVQLKGNRLIVARLNGMLDFVELRFSQNANQMPTKVIQCTHLNTVTAHQLPINALRVAAISAVTASDDHTLKLFDLRTCRQTHTLNGHNAPVLIVCVDETDQVIYSSCAQGNIFCWDLIDGALLRTLDDAFYTNAPVQLACTDALLIGYSNDRKLWMWQKSNGQLITSIKREGDTNNNNCAPALTSSKSCLVALSDQTAVTSQGASVTFWDLRYKVMLRELHLDKPSCVDIEKLIAIDAQSVACCKANNVYRINMPIIRLKNS